MEDLQDSMGITK